MEKRISESSETGRIADTKNISKLGEYNLRSSLEGSTKRPDDKWAAFHSSNSVTKINDFRLEMHPPETLSTEADFSIHLNGQTSHESKEINVTTAANPSISNTEDLGKDELTFTTNEKDLSKGLVNSMSDSVGNEEKDAHIGDDMPVLKQETRIESEKVQNKDKAVIDDLIAMTSELEHLEQELDLTTVVAEMVLNDQHSVDFYLDQLNEQLESKRKSILKLESEWHEEYAKLSADLERQPKVASRKSYIERIKEITKNSRKQDADVERILKETREVQLESNSIQELLHRTYAVADEIIFREAKKDPMGRQVYRLLTSIHQSFEQMSEKILATDRIRRGVAEYEMKLAAVASRNLDTDKKHADLDANLMQPLG